MALSRRLLVLVLLLALPGCTFYGLNCLIFGSLTQLAAPQVDACALFNDDCCNDDAEDAADCDSFVFLGQEFTPCARLDTFVCGCVNPPFGDIGMTRVPIPRAAATYTLPGFTFDLGDTTAGLPAAHRLTFDVTVDSLQTFAGTVTYPDDFDFHGFTALGPVGTQIGSYGVDLDSNGTVDFALALFAAGPDTAFADVNGDGALTAVDPTITHALGAGTHVFTLAAPFGGDTVTKLSRALRAFRVHAALFAGVFTNPAGAGPYAIDATFTSVDPDSGGADDGAGTAPTVLPVVPAVDVVIAPSPLALLDHYFCYKTKPSAGKICGAGAGANLGGLCASDAECGNVAGTCVKNKLPKDLQASVADELGQVAGRTLAVKKPVRLCTPASKNGEMVHDAATHLRGYQVKEAKGTPAHVPVTNLKIVNQLGTVIVDTKKTDTLLVTSGKSITGPAAPPDPMNTVDHYACYGVKVAKKRCAEDPARTCRNDRDCDINGPCLKRFPKGLQVTVGDQFLIPPKLFDVKKPTRLCTPAGLNGSPIQTPEGTQLCYQVKPAKGEPKHTKLAGVIHSTNALGRDRLDTTAEDELCVPSLAIPTP